VNGLLFFGPNCFFLMAPTTVFEDSATLVTTIPFADITEVESEPPRLTLCLGRAGAIVFTTSSGRTIDAIWKAHRRRVDFSLQVVHSVSVSPRLHAVAAALFALARDTGFPRGAALALLEAASRDAAGSLIVPLPALAVVPPLDIAEDDLDALCAIIARCLRPSDSAALEVLAPLFARCLESSGDRETIALLCSSFAALSVDHKSLSVLERNVWPVVTSEVAQEIVFPILASSALSPLIIARLLVVLAWRNPGALGALVVSRFLDGTVRRRSFSPVLTAGKMFELIRTIPFERPEFVAADLSRLLFCAIAGGLHAPTDVTSNARAFLSSALRALEAARPALSIAGFRTEIDAVMKNPKITDAIRVLDLGARLAEAIDEATHAEFVTLLTVTEVGDNPAIWCLKAAAAVHFNCGDSSIALQFIQSVPQIWLSDFGPQKLALVFQSLAILIGQFPGDSLLPVYFLWSCILCLSHSNSMLRAAALDLLLEVIPFAAARGVSLAEIRDTINVSTLIAQGVAFFEEGIGVSFTESFCHALAVAVTRVVQELDTRQRALKLLCICLLHAQTREDRVYLALPLVAFADNDLAWLYAESRCKTIAEYVFQKMPDIAVAKVAAIYLSAMFGEHPCSHRLELMAECILFGIKVYPAAFGPVRSPLLAQCWKMLEVEAQPARTALIAQVASALYLVPLAPPAPPLLWKVDDNALTTSIGSTIDGIGKLLDNLPNRQ
jgi:hypothetical protein